MFLQIHTLTSYHASLLNRDDAGLAKRIPFGNKTRLRISSQCLKRHWTQQLRNVLDLPQGLRTRHFFRREILRRLKDEKQLTEAQAEPLVAQLLKSLITSKEGKKTDKDADPLALKQPILFGKPEADFFVELLADCAGQGDAAAAEAALKDAFKKGKNNFTAMLRQAGHGDLYAGLEGALFGRFVTSDILLARSDACVHVAHALTVHALDTEVDYFTVVDDLRLNETGAAHAGDMELGAGLFYGYVVVDTPLLLSNLTGCDRDAWSQQDMTDAHAVLSGLIRAIATISPGAKLGATAPYAYSDCVLLEVGCQQPRSLANAFLEALPARDDLMQAAVNALSGHLQALDAMYGRTADLRTAACTRVLPVELIESRPLGDAIDVTLKALFQDADHA